MLHNISITRLLLNAKKINQKSINLIFYVSRQTLCGVVFVTPIIVGTITTRQVLQLFEAFFCTAFGSCKWEWSPFQTVNCRWSLCPQFTSTRIPLLVTERQGLKISLVDHWVLYCWNDLYPWLFVAAIRVNKRRMTPWFCEQESLGCI